MCIKNALNMCIIPPNIDIESDIMSINTTFYGDEYHFTEMFRNILTNSIEAIVNSEKESGKIKISIYLETDWLCVTIRDNGVGIKKKDYKKISMPLFSTKKTHTNWGIGLSYVQQVVSAHLGLIFVDSEPGEYSEFQVLVPTMLDII